MCYKGRGYNGDLIRGKIAEIAWRASGKQRKTSTEGFEGSCRRGSSSRRYKPRSLLQKAEVLATQPQSCQVVNRVFKYSKGQKHKRQPLITL